MPVPNLRAAGKFDGDRNPSMVPAGSVAGLVDGGVVHWRDDRGAGVHYQDSIVLSLSMLRDVAKRSLESSSRWETELSCIQHWWNVASSLSSRILSD